MARKLAKLASCVTPVHHCRSYFSSSHTLFSVLHSFCFLCSSYGGYQDFDCECLFFFCYFRRWVIAAAVRVKLVPLVVSTSPLLEKRALKLRGAWLEKKMYLFCFSSRFCWSTQHMNREKREQYKAAAAGQFRKKPWLLKKEKQSHRGESASHQRQDKRSCVLRASVLTLSCTTLCQHRGRRPPVFRPELANPVWVRVQLSGYHRCTLVFRTDDKRLDSQSEIQMHVRLGRSVRWIWETPQLQRKQGRSLHALLSTWMDGIWLQTELKLQL